MNQLAGWSSSGTAAIQSTKPYTNGRFSTVRTITKPVSGAIVYVDGVEKAGTLDTATGLFTPTNPWAGGVLTWTGEFDVPVRFASDRLPITLNDYKFSSSSLDLIEDLSA